MANLTDPASRLLPQCAPSVLAHVVEPGTGTDASSMAATEVSTATVLVFLLVSLPRVCMLVVTRH